MTACRKFLFAVQRPGIFEQCDLYNWYLVYSFAPWHWYWKSIIGVGMGIGTIMWSLADSPPPPCGKWTVFFPVIGWLWPQPQKAFCVIIISFFSLFIYCVWLVCSILFKKEKIGNESPFLSLALLLHRMHKHSFFAKDE